MTETLTEAEQEEIINKFLGVVEMKTIINDKVSICKKCKFNEQNMSLYKLNIPNPIVKHICKYNYEECEVCKTLKQFKDNVYDCSMENFENVVKAVEDKHKYNITNYTEEKLDSHIYYYVKLNPFPTFGKTLQWAKSVIPECKFYNNEFYNEIKMLYYNSFNVDEKVKNFYSKQRNKIINDYDKNVDEENNTKRKFVNHLERQLSKVESVIYTILTYIDTREASNKLKFQLYSNEAYKFINKRIAEVHFEDDYSFERFMDARYPYLPSVPYKKQKPVIEDKDHINSMDDFLT